MKLKMLLLINHLLLVMISNVFCQDKWSTISNINFGCNWVLNYGKAQHFSGYRLFIGIGINRVYKDHLLTNYGASIGLYHKTIGTNLNPLVNDYQFDFTNSFSFGYTWGGDLSYFKRLKTINNSGFYNISTNKDNAVILSANFILNNHRRNQTVGSLSYSGSGFSINYYNDGGTGIDKAGIGDSFDRWWTGGGGIYLHSRKSYNYAEITFDQFTGYYPLLYEITNILGVNLPSYEQLGDSEKNEVSKTLDYNSAAYNIKIFFTEDFALDLGVNGDLKNKKGAAFGIQELIHISGNSPLHPNNDVNRLYFGGTYNNFTNVDL